MKNLTLSLPDEIYRRARIRAAEKQTSVSGLVRELLLQMDAGAATADFERRKRLQEEVLRSLGPFRGGDRLRRDEVHDRGALR